MRSRLGASLVDLEAEDGGSAGSASLQLWVNRHVTERALSPSEVGAVTAASAGDRGSCGRRVRTGL